MAAQRDWATIGCAFIPHYGTGSPDFYAGCGTAASYRRGQRTGTRYAPEPPAVAARLAAQPVRGGLVVRHDYDEYVRLVKMYRIATREVASGDAHLKNLAHVGEAAAHYVGGSTMDPSAHMGRKTTLLEWLRKRWAQPTITVKPKLACSDTVGAGAGSGRKELSGSVDLLSE
jgi:hypothetical protein